MTRRGAIGVLVSALPALAAPEQKPKAPVICLYSKAMADVGYAELGDIVKQLGYDGVDLTVMPHGHVEPQLAPVDEVRALESLHGAGLATPIVTTALTAPSDPWCATVIALAARTGVGLFRSGLNGGPGFSQTARQAISLGYMGRQYGIAIALDVGEDGFSPSQAKTLLTELDPKWSGLSLRSSCFGSERGLSDAELTELLPRVTAVQVSDFVWREHTKEWRPLGQGSVDFARMLDMLNRAAFSGPLSVSREYATKDAPGSLAKDAEFLRKHLRAVT